MATRSSGRLAVVSLVLCLLLLATALSPAPAESRAVAVPGGVAAALAMPHVPGEFIVKFWDEVPEEEQEDALARGGLTELETYAEINAKLAETDPEDLPFVLAELDLDPRVEYAEPNFIMTLSQIPDDPQFPFQWNLQNTGQHIGGNTGVPGADIDAPGAWTVTAGSPNVIVAIIDSGVDFSHPDLGGNHQDNPTMWINPGELCPGCPTDDLDNDGNGYIDDWRGWDFVNQDGYPLDDNGHGTHVAGIIAARANNGEGGAGIAPNTTIMALKSFGAGGGGATGASVAAIIYATNHGASIINASWGGILPSLALRDAIEFAGDHGVLFVAAGGNDGGDTDLFGHFPSALELDNLISVGATNNRDELASFSNYGLKTVDIGAPGQDVYSAWVREDLTQAYRYASGTSMAAPHVAGVAALIKARFPQATPLAIKNLILNSADPLPSLEGLISSGARLNAANAVTCSNQPLVWIDRPVPGFAAVPGEPVEVRALASNCAIPDGISVTAQAGDQSFELVPQGGGLYVGVFSPDAQGPLTITAEARMGDLVDLHAVTGEAILNYRFQNDVFNWLEASGGVEIPFPDERDFQVDVALPFPFTFYNRTFEEITVGENGLIGFGGTNVTSSFNQRIPDLLAPNGFIAPFWDNLDLERGGEIWYDTLGEAPNRQFVVSWIDIPNAIQSSGPTAGSGPFNGITFQVVLEEGTNHILLQYLDASFSLATADYGARATIGVEHFSGTVGKMFSYNEASLRDYEDNMSLRLTLLNPDEPEIVTGSLESAPVGAPYVQRLQAAGGAPPYTWSIVEGGLPEGVGLDPATGTIAGTPYQPGTYSLTAEVVDSAGVTSRQFFSFDIAVGYVVVDDAFEWIDPSDGGEQLPFTRDDEAATVDLPFTFEYYGVPFDEVQVSTNGYLVFGGDRATAFSNTGLPNVRAPNGVVAVHWDDMTVRDRGGVWVRAVGEAPNRKLVVGWLEAPRFRDHGAGTFEVILEEGSNDIVMQYLDLNFNNESYDLGASATVGIENLDGTVGIEFSLNSPLPEQYIGETAIRFTAQTPASPTMNVDALRDAQLHVPYVDLVSAWGGTPPLTWSLTNGELPPGLVLDASTGMISGSPAATGLYSFTAQAVDSADPAQSISADYSIEVLPSYALSDGPFEWLEARDGTRLEFPGIDSAVELTMPFSFTFFGEEFSDVQVSTNGYLVFGGGPAGLFANRAIPDPRDPNGFIAVFWDDLNPTIGEGVWVRTIGEAPNRRLVVSWIDTARFREIGAGTFQIILEEGTNRIIFQYQDVNFDDSRYDYGASATIGLESLAGTVGVQFSFDSPSLIGYEGQKSIVFDPILE